MYPTPRIRLEQELTGLCCQDQLTTPKYGDVHQDNPAEELNMIDLTKPLGKNYGYPK